MVLPLPSARFPCASTDAGGSRRPGGALLFESWPKKRAVRNEDRLRIGLLVTLHPAVQGYQGLPGHKVVLKAGLHPLKIRNRTLWSYAIGQHFS